jgi:hypothetical protein
LSSLTKNSLNPTYLWQVYKCQNIKGILIEKTIVYSIKYQLDILCYLFGWHAIIIEAKYDIAH